MKKYLILALVLCSTWNTYAVSITKGYTFTTNEQVTAAKLHTLVDGATLSGITGSDIGTGTITANNIANNSITSSLILDGTITSSDMASRGLLGTELGTNAVTGIELSTNITFRTGFLNFTNSTVGFGTGAIPLTSLATIPVTTTSSLIQTNFASATGAAGAATWQSIATLTTTATTGMVYVIGHATMKNTGVAALWVRVRDNGSTIAADGVFNGSTTTSTLKGHAAVADYLTGTVKTYVLEVADTSGGSQIYTNTVSSTGTDPGTINGLSLRLIQAP